MNAADDGFPFRVDRLGSSGHYLRASPGPARPGAWRNDRHVEARLARSRAQGHSEEVRAPYGLGEVDRAGAGPPVLREGLRGSLGLPSPLPVERTGVVAQLGEVVLDGPEVGHVVAERAAGDRPMRGN